MRVKAVLMVLAAAAMMLAAAPAEDPAGSSEAESVTRACNAAEDGSYDPPSGRDSSDCYVNGTFDGSRTYRATHYTNDVDCGSDHQLIPGTEAVGVYVSGNLDGSSGFLQACSDGDLPINGRATLEGDAAAGDGSASIDGDKDNQPEQLQGWAKVDVGDQSVRCGDTNGRLDANNPTDEDTQEDCG
ncbi:MAG: hypothetical protein R3320_01610 [Nitriliruptorales bacterium]|nr:hypothetical protein [Nitriliruptorales bacterium]